MKTRIYAIAAAALLFLLTACGRRSEGLLATESERTSTPSVTAGTPVQETGGNDSFAPVKTETVSGQDEGGNTAPAQNALPTGTFSTSLFSGKIKSCAYAGNGQIIVQADKLALYDTRESKVIAEADPPLDDFLVQLYNGGYMLTGQDDNGITAYLYDSNLSYMKTVSFGNLLPEDFVLSVGGVAISSDGTKLAVAGFRSLYLYDVASQRLNTLLSYEENGKTSNMRIAIINGITFSQNDQKLVYIGDGYSIPEQSGENGFSIYGTVSVNGDHLTITKCGTYAVEEMLVGGSKVFMPQTFTNNDGTLLFIDMVTGQESKLTFSSRNEGKDGVFCSEQGGYVATAVLNENLTVNIYETETGKLVHTEVISNADSTYFQRIPQILLLDDSKTAIVLLGRSIREIDTLASVFSFGDT